MCTTYNEFVLLIVTKRISCHSITLWLREQCNIVIKTNLTPDLQRCNILAFFIYCIYCKII